ncbi:MAG: DUF4838 domain-containing protein [Kiritimatiellae bacterium]|nr:DUF4838 domain-containing protein [Kiritimatiellia bacterium]
MKARPYRGLLAVAALALWASGCRSLLAPPTLTLERGGKDPCQIVVGPAASATTQAAAAELTNYLGRITGMPFELVTGDGRQGLAVGAAADFPELGLASEFDLKDALRKEDYILRTHAGGVYLVGATDVAAEHAVYDFLERLGCRWFFPGDIWETVPKNPKPAVALDVKESPSFNTRVVYSPGWGGTDAANAVKIALWIKRNRMNSVLNIHAGHSYQRIRSELRKEFADHPEYLALVGGKRGGDKFCISNPGLRELIANYAVEYFVRNPKEHCISIDPSDFGGWCECDACKAMGSPSTRAIVLANQAAEALDMRYGDKFVGIDAYYQHAAPPAVKVHPKVVVFVATVYGPAGFTTVDLLEGWQAQGATAGIRDYLSVNQWHRDLPGREAACGLAHYRHNFPRFHQLNCRHYITESSLNWGPSGLGYYLAGRVLWDIGAASRIDVIVDDFLDTCFGPGAAPMRRFYALLDWGHPPLDESLLAKMYHALGDAYQASSDPVVRRRLDDLACYTRYVELYWQHESAKPEDKLARFEQLIRFTYRIRDRLMVYSYAYYYDMSNRSKASFPPEALYEVPEGKNPWKSSEPVTAAELQVYVAHGQSYKLPPPPPPAVTFSSNLRPSGQTRLPRGKIENFIGANTLVMLPGPDRLPPITIQPGVDVQNAGKFRWRLLDTARKEIDSGSLPSDNTPHILRLNPGGEGPYFFAFETPVRTVVDWPAGTPVSLSASGAPGAGILNVTHIETTIYFYVPKGTTKIDLARGVNRGNFAPPDGSPCEWGLKTGFTVKPGQDGKIWRAFGLTGYIGFLNIPPYVALSPDELLVPAEVAPAPAPEPVPIAAKLVPSGLPKAARGKIDAFSGHNLLHIAGPLPEFTVKAGIDGGGATNHVFNWQLLDGGGTKVESGAIPCDNTPHPLRFTTRAPGNHTLVFDTAPRSYVGWPAGAQVTVEAAAAQGGVFFGSAGENFVYFYVPKGTERVEMAGSMQRGVIFPPDGAPQVGIPNCAPINIPVKPGQDGKVWKIWVVGQLGLLSVPPYVALSPDELLLPKEVAQ